MKFNIGDRFSVKENGITGAVIALATIGDVVNYVVLWDYFSRTGTYPATEETENLWEPLSHNFTIKVPQCVEFIMSNLEISKSECEHSWQSYFGLKESYDYCSKCDEKRSVT
jgi:hypothetical protein